MPSPLCKVAHKVLRSKRILDFTQTAQLVKEDSYKNLVSQRDASVLFIVEVKLYKQSRDVDMAFITTICQIFEQTHHIFHSSPSVHTLSII